MTPTTGEVAALLIGMLLGVGLVLAVTLMALGFVEWRSAIREGTPLVGEEFERNRRREAP